MPRPDHARPDALPTTTFRLLYHPERDVRLSLSGPCPPGWSVVGRVQVITGCPLRLAPGQALPPGFEAADPARQKPYGIGAPRLIYAPITRRCLSCGEEFCFTVSEQRYWYEELRFCLDATATRCLPCRQRLRAANDAVKGWAAALRAWERAEAVYDGGAESREALIAASEALIAAARAAEDAGQPVRMDRVGRARRRLARLRSAPSPAPG